MDHLRSFGRWLVAAASLFLLPVSASATPVGAILTTSGTNTFSVFIRIECSGLLCFAIGGSTPYSGQTQTSTISGTTGLFVDDSGDSLQFSSDGGSADLMSLTGTDVTFTGFNTTITGGPSNVTISNLVAGSLNAGLADILGFDLNSPPQAINFAMTGINALTFTAGGVTNAPNLPTIELGGTQVDSQGTFVFLGDPDNDQYLDFEIQNLRGAFQTLTSTSTLGVTLRITLRATFTLNFVGESLQQIPEPASFAMMGLGLAAFGLAARRRRALS